MKYGNYCIAGHNYKNTFGKLKKLKEGDEIILIDNWYGEIKYTIYDIYQVEPTEVEVLSQKTDGKKEITLITCSDYKDTRIIIKAEKI